MCSYNCESFNEKFLRAERDGTLMERKKHEGKEKENDTGKKREGERKRK